MAKDEIQKPVPASDKAKAKAADTPEKKHQQADDKKKKDEKKEATEELSEEDQQLKSDLEMLVERLQEGKTELYRPTLDAMREFLRQSTSSMTAVPKPLKFLRPHYETLTKLYDSWADGDDKIAFADILSVLGMTYSDENRLDSLKYRLLSPTTDPGSWGHEYVRHLALEIGLEQNKREEKEEGSDDLIELALSLVPFFLKHNAEADAVDILYELDLIEKLPQFLDENTYARVCLYMVSMVPLLSPPDDLVTLRTAHTIYRQFNKLPQALTMAIRLNDVDLIKEDLAATDDPVLKKQLAFLIGRQHIWLDMEDQEEDFRECVNNIHISEHFLALGKELNILDPKTPEDIYKSHLENTRGPSTTIDSAKQNLANSFVNAFVNAGFTSDKLMLADEDGNSSWVYKNKDEGMLSATASIGVLHRWNVDEGLGVIDRFMESTDANIKAGAALAIGLVNSGVHSETDAAMALLCDEAFLESDKPRIKCSAIMGLGLAYAGSQRQELKDFLIPILADSSNSVEIAATAAIALGNIFVGSSDGDISSNILQVLMEREEVQLKDKWAQFLALGLALLFVGRQEDAEAVLETLKVITDPIGKATSVLVTACAYAGTGNVIKFQSLLEECQDHIDVSEEDSGQDTFQAYAVLGLALIAMGEDIGSEMSLRQFGHLMHYGEPVVRKAVPLAMGLLNASNPQMKVYDTLSRYSHDNDLDVAVNAIFAMGLVGAGTNNARLAQLLRQLASYYHRDPNTLFMVRIAQGLLHMGKGTLSLSPFHTERSVMSRVSVAALLNVAVSLVDAKSFILDKHHYLLYHLIPAIHPRFLITLDEELKALPVNVRVGQAVDVVGQAGRPKTITGWQTHNTPVLLAYGERAELEDDEYIPLSHVMEGLVILKKNPEWQGKDQ